MSGELPSGIDADVNTSVLDFSRLEGTNCWCGTESVMMIREALDNLPEVPGLKWTDTGDYHYLSSLTTERMTEDYGLVVFDHHPDTQKPRFGDVLSCGGWVRESIERQDALKQVILAGVSEELLPECSDLDVVALTEKELGLIGEKVRKDLPLYLSIDLDLLSHEFARTDWDQGSLSLGSLVESLRKVCYGHQLLGVDICGGLCRSKGATDRDLAINAATRIVLKNLFEKGDLQ